VTVSAEGIEAQDQVAALVALECDLGQGFYLGRPEPVPARPSLRPAA
jgi:EAL domain-containing protein (putative c-di-GMP-specific phosphodiesterase class I)